MGEAEVPSSRKSREQVGLCFDCRHARQLKGAKGNEFYRCQRARADASLIDYPPLPVSECHGFVAAKDECSD